MKKILILFTIFISSTALAGPGPVDQSQISAAKLGTTALDLSTSPSITAEVGGYTNLAVDFCLTHDAATDIGMTCLVGHELPPVYIMTSSSAVATLGDSTRTWLRAVTGDICLSWTTDINAQYIKCTFTGTSASSSDILNVTVRRSAK